MVVIFGYAFNLSVVFIHWRRHDFIIDLGIPYLVISFFIQETTWGQVKILMEVVFSHLESDAEKKRCEIAKNNVRLDKAEFASTYFYTFALNKKFCKGID